MAVFLDLSTAGFTNNGAEVTAASACESNTVFAWKTRYLARNGAVANNIEGPFVRVFPVISGSLVGPQKQLVSSNRLKNADTFSGYVLPNGGAGARGAVSLTSTGVIGGLEFFYEMDAAQGGKLWVPYPAVIKFYTGSPLSAVFDAVQYTDPREGAAALFNRGQVTRYVQAGATRDLPVPAGAVSVFAASSVALGSFSLAFDTDTSGAGAGPTVPQLVAAGSPIYFGKGIPIGNAQAVRVTAGAAAALVVFGVEF